jgi:hypothetical protein
VLLGVPILVLGAACSGGGDGALTTPTTPSTVASGGGERGDGVTVRRRGFEAGGGSGLVASARHPGVFWAVRDRGGQDRPGPAAERPVRPQGGRRAGRGRRPRRPAPPLQSLQPGQRGGVAFGRGGHDLVLLAENRDVFSVPATAYQR